MARNINTLWRPEVYEAQGLLAQSEELDELLSKVLSHEMLNGSVARIADDLYVGGASPLDVVDKYQL